MEDIRFSLVDFLNYIEGTERSRCVYEGEQVYNAGHVILCGIHEKREKFIKICALCLQTSALQAPPHKIEGEFIIDNSRAYVKDIICTCKAGNSGRCKHISATLILCTRTSLNKLEYISQTDLKCTWSSQKVATKELYKPVSIDLMPCFSDSTSNYKCVEMNVDDEKLNQIAKNIIQFLPNSAIAMHRKGRAINCNIPVTRNSSFVVPSAIGDTEWRNIIIVLDLAAQSILMMELEAQKIHFVCHTCELFFKNTFSNDSDVIAANTKFNQTNWHLERKYRITGSRVYEIYTYCGKDWNCKAKKYFNYNSVNNKYVRHGLEQEKFARNLFEKMTGFRVIEVGLMTSGANPWLGFSPDGIILTNNGEPRALLEIKCPYMGKTNMLQDTLPTLSYLKLENDIYILKANHKYFAQIQMGMALFNLNICYFVVYCSFDDSMIILEIDFDYEYTKKILFTVKKKFIESMIHVNCTT